MLKLIMCDLDGTVLDTVRDLGDAVIFGLKKYGFAPRSYDEIRQFVGNGVKKLIERALPDGEKSEENIEKVHNAFNEYYSAHFADHTSPYPGMPELLKEIRRTGIKLAVFSNKPQQFTEELIDKFYPDIFDIVRGNREVFPRKPDPAGELEIMKEAGVSPEETVHVGDSDTDVLTAKNAGVTCLACTWGYRSRESLEAASAPFIASTIPALRAELLRLLDK